MSTFKRMCAIVLSMAMIFSVVSTTAFAAEPNTEIMASEEINAEYLAEMEAMGFTEADVAELRNWNLRVANADSMREIDALMDEYQTLVAGTPLAASAAATSFYTSTGGTLELDYTGSFSIFSNVIFTKVVYLPAQQVVYYQNAMNKEGFLDYLISEFVDEGISVITTAVAKKIAAYLGVTTSSVSWLVGGTIGVSVWILQNLDKWDLSDAIDNSTTGKVKLEFYYLQSSFEPYYQEIENFEPWNSSYVEVPEDYDYTWSAGVYDY